MKLQKHEHEHEHEHEHAEEEFGDSDFLAYRDIATNDFRKSEKESKIQLIKKMLELRHNMKYNQHLLSVYLKAKSLFDTMVDEHRTQITYLEEIYNHINGMIRDTHRKNTMTAELLKDKKRIGRLLKKMRNSYDKLTNVYTVIDVTVQKMNELIASIEDSDDTELESDDTELESEDMELESDVESDNSDDTELESEVTELESDVEADEADEVDNSEDEDSEDEVEAEDDEADEADEDDEADEADEDDEDEAVEADDSEDEDEDEAGEADAPFIMVF